MMLQMVGAFAEFEREMIRERPRRSGHGPRAVAGQWSQARAQPPQQAELVRGVKEERYNMAEAARLFQVYPAIVSRLRQ
ncbi:DNA invertase Pin-like site-specific DNA recombinase [Deinococcus sp. UYEF24]